MRTVAVEIYKFEELSDAAKEKAREWYREGVAQDFGSDTEYLFTSYEEAAKLLGITFDTTAHKLHGGGTRHDPDIHWSGFCSQGDGASFSGTYEFEPGCSETIRAEFPTDTTLHKIADKLTALHCRLRLQDGTSLSGKIPQESRYGNSVHSGTMSAVVFDAEGEEMDETTCDEFRDIMRSFADWIYKGLEADYDWQMSDESVDDSIMANDYEFDEDGENV